MAENLIMWIMLEIDALLRMRAIDMGCRVIGRLRGLLGHLLVHVSGK